ncbi:MAG: translation elongation factor Ts [Candidatus Cloacimonetes bacterium]|nr:translation elongation factor Ts [Candidatus Cloacimonadota bacterium]
MASDISIDQIKELREQTGAGVMDAKRALQETAGDFEAAVALIKEKGLARAEKRVGREAAQGLVSSYIHVNGKVGVLLEVNCETDFVGRTEEFKKICRELAMQIAAMNPSSVEELLIQEYIRDASKTVDDLVKEAIAKTGENIIVKRFARYELGEV